MPTPCSSQACASATHCAQVTSSWPSIISSIRMPSSLAGPGRRRAPMASAAEAAPVRIVNPARSSAALVCRDATPTPATSSRRSRSCSRPPPSSPLRTAGSARAVRAQCGPVDGFSASQDAEEGQARGPAQVRQAAGLHPAGLERRRGRAPGAAGGSRAATARGPAFMGDATAAVTLAAAQTPDRDASAQGGHVCHRRQGEPARHHRHLVSRRHLPAQGGDGRRHDDVDLTSSSDNPVALVTTHAFAGGGPVTLTCSSDDTGVVASDAHILAFAVGSVSSS